MAAQAQTPQRSNKLHSPHSPHSPHWESLGPPSLGWFALEQVRAARELTSFFRSRRALLRASPPGDGHPVLALPGFLAGDFSTAPLRGLLRDLCYDARGWKLGLSRGPTPGLRDKLEARLRRLADRHGRKVSLVGWSLGGIYAREMARAHPDLVRQVVTLAAPFRDISATHAVRVMGLRPGGRSLREAHALRAALRRPLAVPTTSLYSQSDGIVHWQGCLEEPGPRRENVEVGCSHTGMGFHPDAVRAITDRLAQPEGRWRPYAPRDGS